MTEDRVPPHSLEAEASVVGSALLSRRAADEVADAVEPDDFYRSSYATLFEGMLALRADGRPVDSVTLLDWLTEQGRLGEVGGASTIHDTVAAVPSAANAQHYARVVRDKATLRRLISVGHGIVRRGYEDGDCQQAVHDSEADVYDLASGIKTQAEQRLRLYGWDDLMELPQLPWLADGICTTGSTLIFGPSDAGKSFLAIDMCLSIASGRPWQGHDVRQGTVVYVAPEGFFGLPQRIRTWAHHHGVPKVDGWWAAHDPVSLVNQSDVALLCRRLSDVDADVVVFDTWARVTASGDENSTADMNRAVANLDLIRARVGCAVVVVHHTGWEDTSRARGNTAVPAAFDTRIRVTRQLEDRVTVECERQKDAPKFRPKTLRMKQVTGSVVLSETGSDADRERALNWLRKSQATYTELEGQVGREVADQVVGHPDVVGETDDTGRMLYRHKTLRVGGR